MAINYSFIDSKERIELSRLEQSEAANPYNNPFIFNFQFDPFELSAMKFIYEYFGGKPQEETTEVVLGILEASLLCAEILDYNKLLEIEPLECFWNPPNYSLDYYLKTEIKSHFDFFTNMINKYPNRGMNANAISRVSFHSYLGFFLRYFNDEKNDLIPFPTIRDAKKSALKNSNSKLLRTLSKYEIYKNDFEVAFMPSDSLVDANWNVEFYKRSN